MTPGESSARLCSRGASASRRRSGLREGIATVDHALFRAAPSDLRRGKTRSSARSSSSCSRDTSIWSWLRGARRSGQPSAFPQVAHHIAQCMECAEEYQALLEVTGPRGKIWRSRASKYSRRREETSMKIAGRIAGISVLAGLVGVACMQSMRARDERGRRGRGFDTAIGENARRLMDEGRATFRSDTFGSEGFWGGALQLHRAIAGEKNGGVGPGLSPKTGAGARPEGRCRRAPAALVEALKARQGRPGRPGQHARAARRPTRWSA